MNAHDETGRRRAAAHARWRSAKRILAVRLDNLGDLLMTTPALAALRDGLPDAHVAVLGSPSATAAAGHLPMIDEIIPFDAPWVRRADAEDEAAGIIGGRELRLVERLAAQRFDGAVIFTTCTQSALPAALLCRLAGIPLRLAHSRENPYELLTDWVPDPDVIADGMRHEVARQLALVAEIGLHARDEHLAFHFEADDVHRLRARLEAAGLDPLKPYFVVHPGATAASRRWPAERFGIAAELIARESGCTAVFTGGAGEALLIETARRGMSSPSLSLAGELSLGELAALITGAQALVANNTGPVHLAAAVGTPVVDLYALTNPQHTPWKVPARVLSHDVPCRNCLKSVCPQGHHACLDGIAPERAAEACLALMGPGPGLPVRRGAAGLRSPATAASRPSGAQPVRPIPPQEAHER